MLDPSMTLTRLPAPSPARLLVALFWSAEWDQTRALSELSRVFGAVRSRSDDFDFNERYTRYYEAEMGASVRKTFVEFEGLHERDSLVQWKQVALELEARHATAGKRTLNVDPMLLSFENLVIATTKNAAHRVCLAPDVFAELALIRKSGRYEALPWTYRDYTDFMAFFEESYLALKQELREKRRDTPES